MNTLTEMLSTLRDLAVLMQPAAPSPTGGIAGLDWRVAIVDTTGAAMGTVGNPIFTSVSGGAVSATDSAAWTAASSLFNPGGGVFNDSAAALTAGQQGTLRMTAQRGQHANLRTTAGADMGLTNDNAAPASLTNLGVLPARSQAVSPSYTEGNQTLLSTNLSGQLRTLAQGYQASGVVVAQNPLVTGLIHTDNTVRFLFNAPNAQNTAGVNLGAAADCRLTQAMGADPTANTAGNYSVAVMNRHAIPFQIGGHPNVKTFAQQYTGAQTDVAVVTQATGGKIVVTGFMILASTANTVNVSARLGFGTANVPAYNAVGILGSHPNIAPGSGFGRGNGSGIIGAGADDEDLRLTISVPTSGAVDVNVTYFVLPT